MSLQKYVFVLLLTLFLGEAAVAQCLMLPSALEEQLQQADKVLEGRVSGQTTFIGEDGNIYTASQIEVYRVFKGDVGSDEQIITEGGVHGNLMQMVAPSIQLQVGDYGVMALQTDKARSIAALTTAFYTVDEMSGSVYGLKEVDNREMLYELIARTIGSETIELRRVPLDLLPQHNSADRTVPQLSSVYPLDVTAGTQTILTIAGEGFGSEQGSGHVAFRNADDGGQSFVALQSGPHYLSWTDTEIQMYVPSATLYNSVVAGTGEIQVRSDNGQIVSSTQQVSVDFAKSEVIYNDNLNSTLLVGMQNGGYRFSVNQQLADQLNGIELISSLLEKWACNTGVNYQLAESLVSISDWAHDDVNVIGMSETGQLPGYMLGRTITTFSGCGTVGDLQWNLIEVDILLNSDIDWWTGGGEPPSNQFDLETSLLHELGHAHLLQHNNDEASPMYFQLTSGTARRELHVHSDIQGGSFVVQEAMAAPETCAEDLHQPFDNSFCNLSVINAVNELSENTFSVYPNPFESELTVKVDWNRKATYSVYDAMGKTVLSGRLTSTQTSIPAASLPRGVYLLEVLNDSDRLAKQLIKN